MKKILATAFLSVILFSGCSMLHTGKGIIKVNEEHILNGEYEEGEERIPEEAFFKINANGAFDMNKQIQM